MFKDTWSRLTGNQGSVLLAGMVLALLLTMVSLAIFDLSFVESQQVVNQTAQSQALRIAEAGLFKALRELTDNNGTSDFSAVFSANQTNFAIFTANAKFPDSGSANGTGAFTVTTTSCATVANDSTCPPSGVPSTVVVSSSGCYPTPVYGSPSCPSPPTAVPAGVTRKTVKASIYLSTGGGFLGGFWGDAFIDFSGANNLADSFDSRYSITHSGVSGYDATRPCATNPQPCWGTKADLNVRAGTGSCSSNCGPTTDSKCLTFNTNGTVNTSNCSQNPSTNIKNQNAALYLSSTATLKGNITTAPNQTPGGTTLTSSIYNALSPGCIATGNCANITGTVSHPTNYASTIRITTDYIDGYRPPPPTSLGATFDCSDAASATYVDPVTGSTRSYGQAVGGGYSTTLPLTPTSAYTLKSGDLTLTAPATITDSGVNAKGFPVTWCIHDLDYSGTGKFTLPNNGTVKNPVVIRMEHHHTMTASGQIDNQTKIPFMFQIRESYNGGAPGQVLYGGPGMYLVVNTPAVNIVLNPGDYYGAMIGRSVDASLSGVKIHVDEALPYQVISGGGVRYNLTSWTVQ